MLTRIIIILANPKVSACLIDKNTSQVLRKLFAIGAKFSVLIAKY